MEFDAASTREIILLVSFLSLAFMGITDKKAVQDERETLVRLKALSVCHHMILALLFIVIFWKEALPATFETSTMILLVAVFGEFLAKLYYRRTL